MTELATPQRLYNLLVQICGSISMEEAAKALSVRVTTIEGAINIVRRRYLLGSELLIRDQQRIWIKNKLSKKKRLKWERSRVDALTAEDISGWT